MEEEIYKCKVPFIFMKALYISIKPSEITLSTSGLFKKKTVFEYSKERTQLTLHPNVHYQLIDDKYFTFKVRSYKVELFKTLLSYTDEDEAKIFVSVSGPQIGKKMLEFTKI